MSTVYPGESFASIVAAKLTGETTSLPSLTEMLNAFPDLKRAQVIKFMHQTLTSGDKAISSDVYQEWLKAVSSKHKQLDNLMMLREYDPDYQINAGQLLAAMPKRFSLGQLALLMAFADMGFKVSPETTEKMVQPAKDDTRIRKKPQAVDFVLYLKRDAEGKMQIINSPLESGIEPDEVHLVELHSLYYSNHAASKKATSSEEAVEGTGDIQPPSQSEHYTHTREKLTHRFLEEHPELANRVTLDILFDDTQIASFLSYLGYERPALPTIGKTNTNMKIIRAGFKTHPELIEDLYKRAKEVRFYDRKAAPVDI